MCSITWAESVIILKLLSFDRNDRFDDGEFGEKLPSKKLKPSQQGIPNFGAMITNAHKGEMLSNANKSNNKYLPKSSANHTLPSKDLTEKNPSSLNKSTAFHRHGLLYIWTELLSFLLICPHEA